MSLHERLRTQLDEWEEQGLRRRLQLAGSGVDFTSNDYLGLAGDPVIAERVAARLVTEEGQARNGSGGSRLLHGHHALHAHLEAALAERFQAEAALLFPSGYQANLALLSALPERSDAVFYDEQCHASLKDGLRLGFAQRFPFAHHDLEQLTDKLRRTKAREKYVVVEALYSMDGSFAPLGDLVALCEREGATLLVDEAHSTGLYGRNGAGYCVALGQQDRVFARVHTFGKGLGAMGACVVGPQVLIDFLVNRARPFIYSTAPPPAQVFLIEEAFARLDELPERRSELIERIADFREAADPSLPLAPGPIQALVCPGTEAVVQAASAMKEAGFEVKPIRTPTVPQGEERLRICLHATHTQAQIDALMKAWAAWSAHSTVSR